MNVGDYVRTKNKAPFEPSQIAKIMDMKKDEGYKNQYFITLDHNLPTTYNFHIYSEDVIKSSPNIIDLIEKKDIIKYHFNGSDYISEVFEYKNDLWVQNENNMFDISEINIKSIVTREQFSQMEYKIQ